MLSLEGWINGLTAMFYVIFGCTLGLKLIFQGKKLNAKLLSYMGFNIFLASLFLLVLCFDFLAILLTGNNLDNTNGWMGIVNMMWAPFVTLISMYIGAELMIPRIKWHILLIFLIMTIIFEFLIFLNPMESFYFEVPESPGENVIHIFARNSSMVNVLLIIFLISGITFCGFGYLIKSIQSKGVIRKKFLLLTIGYFLYLVNPLIGSFLNTLFPLFNLFFVRFGMISGFWFFYSSLREEPETSSKLRPKKEVKIQEALFRLSKRPDHITEEEITYYKEQKICLVCKGKILGFTYICECDALYCEKCARAVVNLENACWVCNAPIDKSKPVNLYESGEVDLDLEISEETKKEPKND